jgi:Toprim domain/CHC2 zinc finger
MPTDGKSLDELFDLSAEAVVYWDVETCSRCDLTECGAYVYAADPSTGMLVMCYAVGNGEVQVWKPGDPPPAPFADPTGYGFVSDNWTFENQILAHILLPQHGFTPIPLSRQDCAQRRALMNAFPAELGRRCAALDLPYKKDPAARRAMLRLSRMHQYKDPAKRERDFALTVERCKTDVAATRAAYNHTRLRPLPPEERHLLLLDAAINARGVRANIPFLTAADAFRQQVQQDIDARIAELTKGAVTTVNQVAKLKDFLNARGHNMASLTKRSVAATLAHDPDDVSRELLELRQRGAHQNVFPRLLAYADPDDEHIRGALRYHGAGPGRWTSPGAQLHGLSRNDAEYPATLIDALMAGNHAELGRFGDPLKVLGQLERAALRAADGCELHCADLSMIESRITAWVAGETWKLAAFKRYDESHGDKGLDPYRVFAHRILLRNSPVSEISAAERRLGKCGELACGFGGGLGAWRRIAKDEDVRSDDEVLAIVRAWRTAHPRITAFWERLARCARSSIATGKPVQVSAAPRIVTSFDGYALKITLPNNRIINYPGAHLVASEKFVNGARDIEFMDNARGQWKPMRAWHGVLTENVVQGIARDLLAAAIVRAEARGWRVVHHAHDELVVEALIGTIPAQDVLALLLEAPPWATGLPLSGKVRSGPLFFEAGDATPIETRPHVELVDDPERTQRESPILSSDSGGAPDSDPDTESELDSDLETSSPPWDGDSTFEKEPLHVCAFCKLTPLDGTERQIADDTWLHPRCETAYARARMAEEGIPWESATPAPRPQAPLPQSSPPRASSSTPSSGNGRGDFVCLICCPFHDDSTPSCALYDDGHYHCFGCEAHGPIEDLDLEDDELAQLAARAGTRTASDARKFKLALKLWDEGKSIVGTLAEHYLIDTRKLDLTTLPSNIDEVLRFHPDCIFGGNGARHPCLLALFRDVGDNAPAGIHRIGLTSDANKIERLTLGRWVKPRAIKLWPATNRLTIGEGLETVLGAIRCGAIRPPVWAVGGRTNIAAFPVLPDIKWLTILVDNDGGQARPDAEACAARYVAAGCKVRLLCTARVKDFNDLTMKVTP